MDTDRRTNQPRNFQIQQREGRVKYQARRKPGPDPVRFDDPRCPVLVRESIATSPTDGTEARPASVNETRSFLRRHKGNNTPSNNLQHRDGEKGADLALAKSSLETEDPALENRQAALDGVQSFSSFTIRQAGKRGKREGGRRSPRDLRDSSEGAESHQPNKCRPDNSKQAKQKIRRRKKGCGAAVRHIPRRFLLKLLPGKKCRRRSAQHRKFRLVIACAVPPSISAFNSSRAFYQSIYYSLPLLFLCGVRTVFIKELV